MAGFLTSLRAMLSELIGDDDSGPPRWPDGLPDAVMPIAADAVEELLIYQGPGYAQLYLSRLKRFTGRRHVDDALFCDIAKQLLRRMTYEDPIRIAQLKLMEASGSRGKSMAIPHDDICKFRFDELVLALPALVGEPVLDVLEWVELSRASVSIKFSAATRWGIRRLKIEAYFRRWRLLSVRYERERIWIERWLHMIDRALGRRLDAAPAVVHMADMVRGYGSNYRQGMADWHLIIDELAKPVFDGTLALPDLSAAIAEARAAARPDRHQAVLKRTISEIKARVAAVALPE